MSADIIIRKAVPDDSAQMIELVQRLAEEPDPNIPLAPGEFNLTVDEERKILADYAASDNSIFLVAEVNGNIIGVLNCIGGKRRATRHAVVLGISVHKDWRDRGVGARLMQGALDWARQTGIVTRIELLVYARNARAIHLYEKFGFQIEGRRRRAVFQKDEYLDDLMMSLLL